MPKPIIEVENISKLYKLGSIGATTLRETFSHHWCKLVGKDHLLKKIGDQDLMISSDHPQAGPEPNTFWALRDVSFSVQQGEIIGVIGKNGAGKSTLLKVLSRITEPTSGRAVLRGRVGSLLEVGTGFHPELTGRENIFLNGAILGMRKREIESKFDEIVSFAEVDKFIDTPVKRYSSGMYVRLAFAVAAHLEPEILLVDEVLAVGDASFQKKCLGKMKDISGEGRTVIFVSHNMAAVSQLCKRGILLKDGQIAASDHAGALVKRYLAGEASQRAERWWTYPGDAPGDDRIRLLASRIVQNGCVAPVVDINEQFHVEMSFSVQRDVTNLVAAINLYNAEGLCLLCSADWRPNQFSPGLYRTQVNFPPHLLAEGRTDILLQLVFYDPDVRSVVVPGALTFDAVDSDHPQAVRGSYREQWPGAVRIALKWDAAEPINELPMSSLSEANSAQEDILPA